MNRHEPIIDNGMPSQIQAKATLAISRDEILLGRQVARRQFNRLEDAVNALVAAFEDGRYAEIKHAGEAVRAEARTLGTLSSQIEYVAAGIVGGCVHQLNRRPRI